MLGRLWVFLAPFLMLMVYTFVFGHILRARWGAAQDNTSFALTLFAGLLLNGMFGESLSRAAVVMHNHSNYVKKLVFPTEVLPLSLVAASLVNSGIGYLIIVVAMLLLNHPPGLWVVFLPLSLLPFLLCVTGLTFMIAAFGAYFRDVNQIVQFLLVLLLFLSPVLYPMTSLPEDVRHYLLLNPLTIPVEMVRALLFGTPMPPTAQIAAYSLASVLLLICGVWLFLRVRGGFADVL
ncbi:ABC transporter permease [Pseudomonas sp. ZM23]|uniref:Transport permease protein n=2 Tax=Pseudomonas triclosanedens TaxID=2961893 RepID=A0ABY7A8M6_9PSED|nr:ABC transporter permease [Pseudomonas triclosanedens]MCP8464758.1 ABC transporter permease [Pseudomonas triclosanedens]MCP8470529.1 ABC transporter permease [Pseudomonas triclosanedens]MCP8476335.1 ABC transporter permease [Pseudomonas triclosanedens]WAI52458.1 ABC transporter permease [Pseudomonas triclosanedens]